ncbi:MAG: exodeoxyribonuclease VII small subunit [Elusimicrobia bacterium]|jgi:exodeoxyribonuclease VII small subunit|nr:exodeoxyribonuclease VII small subunit [Elusimicrobiota bacterium]MBK7206830.1 exodeoxyribonuclease VII small subunit [Elusimicrobiota bacterium]MBK7545628.1 exodeoxyribonuclease VII small subunit [Elusimicrobiota bacterium]MBK7575182.1 exodeoxyribonuclease VII small subunit [Elusimicrobiota bacterium]MBK7687823.1 exodeoxyribonuclease VII small subunit [Elusimicrobiota bacterium]
MSKKSETYAQAYAEVQKILEGLDQGDIDVDDLSEKVKRAAELIDFCQKRLRETELQVKRVMEKLEKPAEE